MKQLILALLVLAAPVQAFEWPWQTESQKNYDYCKGFIFASLGAFPMKGMSRTQLWLNWNHVIQAGLVTVNTGNEQYDAGRSKFDTLLASNDDQTLVDIANGECDLGDS